MAVALAGTSLPLSLLLSAPLFLHTRLEVFHMLMMLLMLMLMIAMKILSTFPSSLGSSFPSPSSWGLSNDVDDNGDDVDDDRDEFLPPSSSAWRSFGCKLFTYIHFIQILASESAHEIHSPQIFLWNIELSLNVISFGGGSLNTPKTGRKKKK